MPHTRSDPQDRLPNRVAAKEPACPERDPEESPSGLPSGIQDTGAQGRIQDPVIGQDAEDDLASGFDEKLSGESDLDPDGEPDRATEGQRGGKSNWDSDEDDALKPQPSGGTGVHTDMATLALDPRHFEQRHFEGGNHAGQARSSSGLSRLAGSVAELSDADIMLRVREGDDSCFNYLIEKYRRPIMSFMFRMVHNQAVAEELAQEVFLRVYRSRSTYRAEAKFSTWLYRIATNLGVNHARDTKYERTAQNVYLDEPDAETGTTPDLADSTPTVEQDLVRNERFRAIRQHVMALPERQRTAVLMHKYQGMDYKQIGDVLKLSESATKSLLFRAYQTLRERLKDFV